MPVTVIVSPRQKEIYEQYLQQLDAHMQDLKEGKAERVLEIRELAALLHIHPVHLSNTIKEVSGKSTFAFCPNFSISFTTFPASSLLLR